MLPHRRSLTHSLTQYILCIMYEGLIKVVINLILGGKNIRIPSLGLVSIVDWH